MVFPFKLQKDFLTPLTYTLYSFKSAVTLQALLQNIYPY